MNGVLKAIQRRERVDRDRHHVVEVLRRTWNDIDMTAMAVTVSDRQIQVHGTYAFGGGLQMYNDTDHLWIDQWRWRHGN